MATRTSSGWVSGLLASPSLVTVSSRALVTSPARSQSRAVSVGVVICWHWVFSVTHVDSHGAITISFTAEGSIGWEKDLITLDEFITRLQAYKQSEPNPRILINGDEAAMFSQSRYVIDEIRKAGITKVLLETRVRSTGS